MRKLVYGINISMDGYCDHTLFNPDDEVLDYFTALTQESDVLLYGRKTYELMIPYWPEVAKNNAGGSKAENDFAKAFCAVPHIVVVSKTFRESKENKTRFISTNLEAEMKKLKEHSGGNILVGGVQLPTELLKLRLIDEVNLVIHPAIVGKGRRIFDGTQLNERVNLALKSSKIFKSGCVALNYSVV